MPNKLEFACLRSEIKKADDGTYEFIMSEETVDRDGEIIEVDGWDTTDFKDNSILLFGHRHDIPGIGVVGRVAKGVSSDGKKQLIAKKVRFASTGIYELADIVHGLVDDEVIKATSVGFQALDRQYINEEDRKKEYKNARVRTKRASLYELSIVNVGAHPAALRTKSAADKAAMEYQGKDITEIQTKLLEDLFEKQETMENVDEKKEDENIKNKEILTKLDIIVVRLGEIKTIVSKNAQPKRMYDGLFERNPEGEQTKRSDQEEDLDDILPKAKPITFFEE